MEKGVKKTREQGQRWATKGVLSRILNIGLGKDIDDFVENLSILVGSGMGILDALDAISADMRSQRMRRAVEDMKADLAAGVPLWKTLARTSLFQLHTVSLLKIGEESGKLSENLRVISLQQVKERALRSKMNSALLYPVFVLSLTVIIGVGVAWFILPKLALVFSQLKLSLPLITKVLIYVGTFLGNHGATVVPIALVVFAFIIFVIFYFPKTRLLGQTLLFWFPGIKKLIQEVELSRFGYLLGTLLQAGLPVTRALDALAEATTFPHYKNFYQYLARSVEEGNSFQKSFKASHRLRRLIPTPIQQLIVAGEKSGSLPETLLSISRTYEGKTETTTKNLTIILEPILLVVVWLGVVAVALAVILPIYDLIGGFNAGGQQTDVPVASPVVAQSVPPAAEEHVSQTEIVLPKEVIQTLKILPTTPGYLNVHETPALGGKNIGRVKPGEIYSYTRVQNHWYEIVLPGNTSGWVVEKFIQRNDIHGN